MASCLVFWIAILFVSARAALKQTTTDITLAPASSNYLYGQQQSVTVVVQSKTAPTASTPALVGSVTCYVDSLTQNPFVNTLVPTTTTQGFRGIATVTFVNNHVSPTGSHVMRCDYSGSGNDWAQSSNTASWTVIPASVNITATPQAVKSGQTVTIKYLVNVVSPGGGSLKGLTLKFTNPPSNTLVVTGTIDATGKCNFVWTVPKATGSYTINAKFAGNANFNPASINTDYQIVQGSSQVVLTSSNLDAVFKEPLTFTATVTPVAPAKGIPTGTVTFYRGSTHNALAAPVTLKPQGNNAAVATYVACCLPANGLNTLHILAVYSGDSNFVGSTAQAIEQAVSSGDVTFGFTATPSIASYTDTIVLKASLAGVAPSVGVPTGSVTFFDDVDQIGNPVLLKNGIAQLPFAKLEPGVHTLTAQYSGDFNPLVVSDPVTVTINPGTSVTSLVVYPQFAVTGQTTTLKGTIRSTVTGFYPDGTITFFDDVTPLGSGSIVSGAVTISISFAAAGVRNLKAQYTDPSGFFADSFDLFSFPVSPATTTTLVTSSVGPVPLAYVGQSTSLTAIVSVNLPGTIQSLADLAGSVVWTPSGSAAASNALANGVSTFQYTTGAANAPPATKGILANYSGNSNYAASWSTIILSELRGVTTTVINSFTPASTTFGQNTKVQATVTVQAPSTGIPTGFVNFYDTSLDNPLGSASLTAGVAQFNVASLSVGTHPIIAVYTGSTRYEGSQSSAVSTTVNLGASTISVNMIPPTSLFGQPVQVVIHVAPSGVYPTLPTGTITVSGGGVPSTVLTLYGGEADFTTTALTASPSDLLTFVTSGDSNFASQTTTKTITVSKAPVAVTFTSSTATSVFGQLVTFTATVTVPSPGSGSPGGSIVFDRAGTQFGATVQLTNGVAVLTWAQLPVGSHTLHATYSGDGSFAQNSQTLTFVVTQAETSVSVTASNPILTGQATTLTASVSVSFPGSTAVSGVGGDISFYFGNKIGNAIPVASGSASLVNWIPPSNVSAGAITVTVVYSGDSNFLGSTFVYGLVEQQAATQVIIQPISPNPSVFGQTLAVTASLTALSPAGGSPSGFITFFYGDSFTTTLGTSSVRNGQAIWTTTALDVNATGTSIYGYYGGDSRYQPSLSNPYSQIINKGDTSVTLVSSNLNVAANQPVTFTAYVNPVAPATGTPTGTITINRGGQPLSGSLPISGNSVTFTISTLGVTTHSITATYNGDSHFSSSTSLPPLSQVVTQAPTLVTLFGKTSSVFQEPVTFEAIVETVPASSTTLTGNIAFSDNGTPIPSSSFTVSGNSVTFTTSAFSVGAHSITATYTGDATSALKFAPSTSVAASLVVAKAITIVTLSSSTQPIAVGQSTQLTATVTVSYPGVGLPTVPTGTVTFWQGSNQIGSAQTLSAAQAQVTYTPPAGTPTGTIVLRADYTPAPDAPFSASSGDFGQAANPGSTTVAVTTSVTPSVMGQPITLTATVSPSGGSSGTPTGSITFFLTSVQTPLASRVQMVLGSAFLTFTPPAVGTYQYRAFYSGDSYFTSSTSPSTFQQQVNQGVTTLTALSPASYSLAWGETTTFSTTLSAVAPSTGLPTGTVTFVDLTAQPPVAIGAPITLSTFSGLATLTINSSLFSPSTGFHQIVPSYSGDVNYQAFQPGSGQGSFVSVIAAPTKVTLSSSVAQPVYSQPLTITATFTVAPGSGYIVGTATFQDNGGTIAGGTVTISGNQALLTPSSWSATTHPITVSTTVDPTKALWSNVASATFPVTISRASTTVACTSSINPLVAGQTTTLTVTVSPVAPALGVPSGSVTFNHGGTPLPGGNGLTLSGSGQVTLTYTPPAGQLASDLVFSILFSGDSNWLGSSTTFAQTQAAATTSVTITANPANGLGVAGQGIVLTATVNPTGGAVGTPSGFLIFYDGANNPISGSLAVLPGTNGLAQASLTVSNFAVNLHSITATYSGDNKFSGSSTSGSFQVSVSQATPTVTVTSSAPGNSASFGQSVSFTATVLPPFPGVTPTGTVSFLDNGSPIAGAFQLPLTLGAVTFVTNSLQITVAGSPHSITAKFNGDSNLQVVTSSAVSLSVGQVVTTLSLVGPSSAVYNQQVAITVLITTSATNAGTPSGTLTISDNGVPLSPTYPVTGYSVVVTLTTLGVSATSHSITANYGGDQKFVGSSSSPIPILVSKAATTLTLSTSAALQVGQPVLLSAQLSVNSPSVGVLTTGATETITFSTGGSTIGTPQQFTSAGAASVTFTPQSSSDLIFSASYGGDGNFLPSSSVLGQSVARATPSVQITFSPVLLFYGQSVTLSATVSGTAGGPTPTGSVTFFDNGNALSGVIALVGGVAQLTYPLLSQGTHPISVIYSGDSRYTNFTQAAAAGSQISFSAATTALALQNVPAAPYYGQVITLIAVVSITNGNSLATNPVGNVSFVVNGVNLGQSPVVNGAATLALSGTLYQVGSVGLSLTYSPTQNSGYASSTLSTTINIVKANTTLTLIAENNPAVLGQGTNFQVVVNVPSFGAIPTGSITFTGSQYTGISSPKVVNLDGIVPSVNQQLTLLGHGSHTITAVYSGDANFLGSSVTIPVQVSAIPLLGGTFNGIALYQVPVIDPLTPMTNNIIISTCQQAHLAYTCIGALSCCGTQGTSGYACDSGCKQVFTDCNTPFQDLTQQMCKSADSTKCFPINNIFMFAGSGSTSLGYGVGFEDGGGVVNGQNYVGQYALCAAP